MVNKSELWGFYIHVYDMNGIYLCALCHVITLARQHFKVEEGMMLNKQTIFLNHAVFSARGYEQDLIFDIMCIYVIPVFEYLELHQLLL